MYDLTSGGAERSLVNLLNEMDSSRYEISLLLFDYRGLYINQIPDYVRLIKAPYTLTGLYNKTNLKKIKYYPVYFFKVVSNIITNIICSDRRKRMYFRWRKFYSKIVPKYSEKFDIVCAFTSGTVTYYVGDKIVGADKKISWNHNDYNSAGYYPPADIYYYKMFERVVTISEKCKEALIENLPEYEDKFIVIPNITSSRVIKYRANEFYPEEYNKETVNLLTIGRLSEQKNYDLLLETAKLMCDSGVRFEWFIIGIGPLEKKLKEKMHLFNLEKNVHFLGQRENPYPYIKNAYMVVQTSKFEGKSIVLDEAKILSKPIVSTNYPTVYNQIEDHKEGLITGMTAGEVAKAIELLINNKSVYDEISGYLCEHHYGNESEISQYNALFEG